MVNYKNILLTAHSTFIPKRGGKKNYLIELRINNVLKWYSTLEKITNTYMCKQN